MEIAHEGRAIRLRGRKAVALLLYLVVEQEQHSRESLLGLFWPEMDDARARNNLRVALARLRRRLPAGTVGSSRHYVWFSSEEQAGVDFHRFQALLGGCAEHPRAAVAGCTRCHRRREAAVALYRGEFLADFHVGGCPAFDEWLHVWRERLHVRVVALLGGLVEAQRALGNIDLAAAHARRQLELDPLYEPAHRALMDLYGRQRQRSQALAQYQTLRDLLERELAVEPDGETTAMWQALRAESGEAAAPAPPRDPAGGWPLLPAPGEVLVVVEDLAPWLAAVPDLSAMLRANPRVSLLVASRAQLLALAGALGQAVEEGPAGALLVVGE